LNSRGALGQVLDCGRSGHSMSSLRTLRRLHPLLAIVLLASCRSTGGLDTPSPSPAASNRPAEIVLTAGQIADIELSEGGTWKAAISVASESYLQLAVEQRSTDAMIEVLDAGGDRRLAIDGPGGIGVDERAACRLPAGSYELTLVPRAGERPNGWVRLRVEALRPFEPGDEERLPLIRLGQEATHLDGSHSKLDWQRSHELSVEELAGWRRLGVDTAIIRTLNRLVSLEREFGRYQAQECQQSRQCQHDTDDVQPAVNGKRLPKARRTCRRRPLLLLG